MLLIRSKISIEVFQLQLELLKLTLDIHNNTCILLLVPYSLQNHIKILVLHDMSKELESLGVEGNVLLTDDDNGSMI